MLDLNFVRDNLPLVAEKIRQRGMNPSQVLKDFGQVDSQRRQAISSAETLQAHRNRVSEEIAVLKKTGQDATELIEETRNFREEIQQLQKAAEEYDGRLRKVLVGIPNLPHESVPVGHSAKENVEVRRWGAQPEFSFEPKDHVDLGTALGILDLERATKITGARFAILNGAGARLERALIDFMLDLHTREHGYLETLPPFIVNRDSLFGTGQLPKFAEDLFKLEDERGFYLVPTAEVPVTNYYREEILDASQLPMKWAAYTPCFRSEAGSYGKDTRGVIRQHQFEKVELVKYSLPENSYAELEALTLNAETVLQRLGIHYRVVALSTGDLGFSNAKTYDIEVWLPSQNTFREISSCSNYEAFQARRANIRFRRAGGAKPEFVHTLNGSGLAVGRTWIAVLENFQQADGSVLVPEVLRPFMGGLVRIAGVVSQK